MKTLIGVRKYPGVVERYYSNGVLEREITEEVFKLKEKSKGGEAKR